MPRSTGWRTDPELYPTDPTPFYSGIALVDGAATEAAARAASVTADTSGFLETIASHEDPEGTQYRYGQGFVIYDFDPLINPVDPTVTYEPQIPWDDPDTERPDWLGNLLFDPAAGVIFEEPQGTLATDQPVEITTVIFNQSGGTVPAADLHLWLVDDTVVYHDGTGWHETSVPLNNVLAAAAASPHHLVAPSVTGPGFFGWGWIIDLNHELFTFADLRADNSIAFALSIDPSTDGFSGSINRVEAVRGGPINAQLRYRNPRYRLLFGAQRNFPRDDGSGISTARSFPPQIDSIRSYPQIP